MVAEDRAKRSERMQPLSARAKADLLAVGDGSVDGLMKVLDANGDQLISKDEFYAALRGEPPPPTLSVADTEALRLRGPTPTRSIAEQVADDRARREKAAERAANPNISMAVPSPYHTTSSAAEYADTWCAATGALLARQLDAPADASGRGRYMKLRTGSKMGKNVAPQALASIVPPSALQPLASAMPELRFERHQLRHTSAWARTALPPSLRGAAEAELARARRLGGRAESAEAARVAKVVHGDRSSMSADARLEHDRARRLSMWQSSASLLGEISAKDLAVARPVRPLRAGGAAPPALRWMMCSVHISQFLISHHGAID